MKRIRITLITMVVLIAAAIGIYLIVNGIAEKNKKKAAEEASKLVIFDFDANASTNLKIHNESGDYEMAYNQSEGWKMTSEVDFEANSSTASSICAYMASLTAQKIIEDTDTDKFGFSDPSIVTVTSNGKDYTLKVGDPTPTNESYYVMKEGSDNIYLIEYMSGVILSATKNSLKNTYMADFLSTEVEHFALWKGGESDENILFSMNIKDDKTWYMEKPYKDDSVYTSDVDTFINDCIRDTIYTFGPEHCPESDYEKYGFDDPQYVFEISGKGKYVKVIFGDLLNDDAEMYALLAETGQVVTFQTNAVETLKYDTSDMMSNNIYKKEIDKIKSISVSMPEHTAEVEIDSANGKYKIDGVEIDNNNEEIYKAYFNFLTSVNSAYFESVDRSAKPSGESEVTVKYALTDGTETTIEYIPIPGGDSNTYWAMMNGEYTGFIVRKKIVANISKTYEALEALM